MTASHKVLWIGLEYERHDGVWFVVKAKRQGRALNGRSTYLSKITSPRKIKALDKQAMLQDIVAQQSDLVSIFGPGEEIPQLGLGNITARWAK